MRWLRETIPGEYYVGNNNGWHGAVLSNNLRYLDAWYGFAFEPPMQGAVNARPVRASPNYLVIGNDQIPSSPMQRLCAGSQPTLSTPCRIASRWPSR